MMLYACFNSNKIFNASFYVNVNTTWQEMKKFWHYRDLDRLLLNLNYKELIVYKWICRRKLQIYTCIVKVLGVPPDQKNVLLLWIILIDGIHIYMPLNFYIRANAWWLIALLLYQYLNSDELIYPKKHICRDNKSKV